MEKYIKANQYIEIRLYIENGTPRIQVNNETDLEKVARKIIGEEISNEYPELENIDLKGCYHLFFNFDYENTNFIWIDGKKFIFQSDPNIFIFQNWFKYETPPQYSENIENFQKGIKERLESIKKYLKNYKKTEQTEQDDDEEKEYSFYIEI